MKKLRVLLVPDWLEWVTGTIAKDIARYNPWISATILSGPVLRRIAPRTSAFFDRFDVVHFLCPFASADWLDHLRDKVPVVTPHFHVTDFAELAHNLQGDAIVPISSEWARDLEARGADMGRVVVIPPGIDTNLFLPRSSAERQALRSRLGFASAQPVIGFVAKRGSNDEDRKGTDVFVRAIEALAASGFPAGILIVGPGWSELAEKFRNMGMTCTWLPFVEDRADLAPLYSALDFYWVTSRVEGGPVPLLEAMSSGVACLSTPVGLAADIGRNEVNLMLLPFEDAAAFATHTRSIWNDESLKGVLAANARATIKEKLDTRITSRRFGEAYEIATRKFAERNPGYSAPDVNAMSARGNESGDEVSPGTVPRTALGKTQAREAQMLEKLLWAEHLSRDPGQASQALRMMIDSWFIQPRSLSPASALLRHFLPGPVVRGIVRAKRALR